MAFVKISEQSSLYNDLEKKSVGEILHDINTEDKKVALAVEQALQAASAYSTPPRFLPHSVWTPRG